jgi:hypothetical protein
MPDRWNTYRIELKGGLITNLSQLQHGSTAPGSARILRNFEPSIFGGYRRIEGFSKHDTNALSNTGVVRGILRYKDNVFAARGNGLFRSSGSGWTEITNNATFSSTGINLGSGSSKVRFLKYDFDGTEKFLVVDGDSGNKPFRFTNTVFSELTALPNDTLGCTHVVNFKNHVFLASGKKLIFSAPYDETDFTSASGGGIINIGDNITGLVVFREQLIVFSENTINRITGSSIADFQLVPVSRDLGCVAEDTIQEIGGDILFLGPDGIRSFSSTERIGDFNLAVVSKPIQTEVLDLISSSSSFTSLVIREKSQYRIFGYNSAYQSSAAKAIAGTQLQDGVSWNDLRGFKAYVSYSEYDGNAEFAYFANEDGYVYRMEQGNTFDGTNIVATFATPYIPIQDPNLRKTVFKATTYIDADGQFDLLKSIKYDFDQVNSIQPASISLNNSTATSVVYGSGIYGTSTFGTKQRYIYDEPVTGSGFTVSVLYETTGQTTDSTFTIDATTIQFGLYGRR